MAPAWHDRSDGEHPLSYRSGRAQRQTDLAEAPRQLALPAARLHQEPRAPQFGVIEPFDDDFRPAGQPGRWIEIARVEDQDAGHQLLEAETAAAVDPRHVGGQAPASVK